MKSTITIFLTLSAIIIACKKSENLTTKEESIFSKLEENGKIFIENQIKNNEPQIEKINSLKLIKIDTATQKSLALNYANELDREFYEFMKESVSNNSLIDSANNREKQISKIAENMKLYDTIQFRNYVATYYVEVINRNKTINRDTIRVIFDKSGYVADKNDILNNARKEFK